MNQQISIDALLVTKERNVKNRFYAYHSQYPEVYEVFKELTLKAIKKGHKHFSARGIFQVMRYQKPDVIKKDGYKYNNNYTPYYARLFEKEHPQHIGFFEKRKVQQQIIN